ncbi:spore germination protein [Paenibacillus prosopidis]|uniref:Spore germination protein KA n=1 Tax=Paenibacillus prosopidis TaxID=630520 RepID=A0A368W367_9BACL|nr:spore germination protein [Paenibacillus prosopidis]RCW49114.1 spore germination protein KA [Paenibacillus prosopidis]
MFFGPLIRAKKKQKKKEIVHELGFQEDKQPLERDLDRMVDRIKQELGNSPDVIVRTFQIGSSPLIQVAAIYIEGLTDIEKVNDFVTHSLLFEQKENELPQSNDPHCMFDVILSRALTVGDAKYLNDWNVMMHALLSGDIAVFVDNCEGSIIGNLRGGERRGVTAPETEVNIRGPRDSFNESIGTNVSLIRRRLKSPNLWLESMRVGNITQTDVSIMYLKGIAEDRLVEEVRRRLKDIRIDAILESGNIEDLIQDQTYTPFPTIYNSERPDVVVGNLLEGRIAVLVDGTPNTLILPTTFSQFFKAAEDYYQRVEFTVFMRLIRYFGFFVVMLLPSMYIAVTTHHHEMIPTLLAINLLAQREGVPFPVFFEAFLMEAAFELMREAGTRMPRAVGQAVSTVGAIVLGQAAVEAGIVTAMMVIVVSFTGIASFTLPGFTLTTSARLIRFPMMLAASTFGFYGIFMCTILIVAHLTSLRSFGIPYLSPFAPFGFKRQKDTLWRSPFKTPATRPGLIGPRQETSLQKDGVPSSDQNDQTSEG